MQKLNKLIIGFVSFLLLLFTFYPVYAQNGEPIQTIPIISECLSQSTIIDKILCIIQRIFFILGFVALAIGALETFRAAWTFMRAGEKAEEVGKARSKIVFAIVGLVVALLSFAIAWFVKQFLESLS